MFRAIFLNSVPSIRDMMIAWFPVYNQPDRCASNWLRMTLLSLDNVNVVRVSIVYVYKFYYKLSINFELTKLPRCCDGFRLILTP